nr:MAG TPA: hypothetical protein [Caudoviricetes sp.]DAY28003.1 MAG TPA: hypothetical protein [Caudoviricetes sp.]
MAKVMTHANTRVKWDFLGSDEKITDTIIIQSQSYHLLKTSIVLLSVVNNNK